MAKYWACAQTKPRQEEIALRNLQRQNFTVFYPFFMVPRTRHGIASGQYLAKPAFPSYVFVQLDDDYINWSPINFTLGVRRLLTYAESEDKEAYRFPCRANFVEDLWRVRVMPSDRPPDLIPVGTTVKITRGPFAEKIALVTLSSEDRVRVLLEVFNREVMLEFDVDAVERITRPGV
jgi:transcriptional antiterminator RfaH